MNVILRDKDRYLCQKVKGSPIHNMIMEHGRKSTFYKPIPFTLDHSLTNQMAARVLSTCVELDLVLWVTVSGKATKLSYNCKIFRHFHN